MYFSYRVQVDVERDESARSATIHNARPAVVNDMGERYPGWAPSIGGSKHWR